MRAGRRKGRERQHGMSIAQRPPPGRRRVRHRAHARASRDASNNGLTLCTMPQLWSAARLRICLVMLAASASGKRPRLTSSVCSSPPASSLTST